VVCADDVGQAVKALRYYFAGSIPIGVTGICYQSDTFDRTWPLAWTEVQIKMNTRNVSWGGKGGQCIGLTFLPPSCSDCL
jgi:hypothetical protein